MPFFTHEVEQKVTKISPFEKIAENQPSVSISLRLLILALKGMEPHGELSSEASLFQIRNLNPFKMRLLLHKRIRSS